MGSQRHRKSPSVRPSGSARKIEHRVRSAPFVVWAKAFSFDSLPALTDGALRPHEVNQLSQGLGQYIFQTNAMHASERFDGPWVCEIHGLPLGRQQV